MPLPRPKKTHWLALLLGGSLLLNVALLSLATLRRDRQARLIDRQSIDERPGDVAAGSRTTRVSARAVTEDLPPGYRMILRGHAGSITALAFSADHLRLGVTTDRGYLTVWNLTTKEVVWESHRLGRDDGYGLVNDLLALSKAGDQLVYAVSEVDPIRDSFTVHIRDLEAERETTLRGDKSALELGRCVGLALSPDRRTVATGGIKGVALFDVAGGDVRAILRAERRFYYRNLNYSENGTYLLARTLSSIALFDTRSGKIIADLRAKSPQHYGPCNVVLAPDAGRIATSFWSNEATLWDARTGQEIAPIKEGLGSAISDGRCWVAFTSDGQSILTASRDDDGSRILVRRRITADGSLVNKVEIVQPGGTCPYVYPRLFTADGTKLALVGLKDENRFVPEPDMGIVTGREGVVAIYDTSQLLDGRSTPLTAGQ
jgi:WD40 repeat protein